MTRIQPFIDLFLSFHICSFNLNYVNFRSIFSTSKSHVFLNYEIFVLQFLLLFCLYYSDISITYIYILLMNFFVLPIRLCIIEISAIVFQCTFFISFSHLMARGNIIRLSLTLLSWGFNSRILSSLVLITLAYFLKVIQSFSHWSSLISLLSRTF